MTTDGLFARVERLFDVEAFRDLWVLIAGCGSGGGQVALQLVMSGVRRFILLDMDVLEIENVIRHVCGMRYRVGGKHPLWLMCFGIATRTSKSGRSTKTCSAGEDSGTRSKGRAWSWLERTTSRAGTG